MMNPKVFFIAGLVAVAIGAFSLVMQYQAQKAMRLTIEQTLSTLDQVKRQVDKSLLIDSLQSVHYQEDRAIFDSLVNRSNQQLLQMDKAIKNQSYNVWKLRQTFDSLRVDLPEF